jgi:hypothetical protein
MWVLGWWTKVVVSPDGVVIDNVIVRHVVPAGQQAPYSSATTPSD